MPLYRRQKRSRPFGKPETPFDPVTGKYLIPNDLGVHARFTVLEAGGNLLLCADRDGEQLMVARAWLLRSDKLGIGGDDGTSYPYFVGQKILAARILDGVPAAVADGEFTEYDDVETGDYVADWEDINAAAAGSRARALLVTSRDDGNLLDCQLLDREGNQVGTLVVAREDEAQAAFYVGTWGGQTYTKTDKDTREVDGTETQEITPSYVEGKTILTIVRIPDGVGIDDETVDPAVPVQWIDSATRTWAKQ